MLPHFLAACPLNERVSSPRHRPSLLRFHFRHPPRRPALSLSPHPAVLRLLPSSSSPALISELTAPNAFLHSVSSGFLSFTRISSKLQCQLL